MNDVQDLFNLLPLLLFWIPLNVIVGAAFGRSRGRVGEGIALSLLLGPIGWLLVYLGKDTRRKCPACAEVIQRDAKLCPHCRSDVTPPPIQKNWTPPKPKVLPPPALKSAKEDPYETWAREHPTDTTE